MPDTEKMAMLEGLRERDTKLTDMRGLLREWRDETQRALDEEQGSLKGYLEKRIARIDAALAQEPK